MEPENPDCGIRFGFPRAYAEELWNHQRAWPGNSWTEKHPKARTPKGTAVELGRSLREPYERSGALGVVLGRDTAPCALVHTKTRFARSQPSLLVQ